MHFYLKFRLWLIGFGLVYCVGVNERENRKSREQMFQSNTFVYEHKNVYCVYTRNLGANLWLLLGAKSMPFGCMSMARLGAKYAVAGCKVYGYFWVHVYTFWVHVYGLVGCMYAVVGCMPDCR